MRWAGAPFRAWRIWGRMLDPALPLTPEQFLHVKRPSGEKVVVMLGDSLTEGKVSANFVTRLQAEMHGYTFVNAGVGGELTWNVLQRLEPVIACHPLAVVILIGTNDAQAAATPQLNRFFIRRKHLPVAPTAAGFRQNLAAILTRLQAAGVPHIAVLSLGLYGEDLDSPANRHMARYSQWIQEIAQQTGVACLPLHAHFRQVVQARQPGDRPGRRLDFSDGQMFRMLYTAALWQRPILGYSLTRVAAANRFHLLVDGLHFSPAGAQLVQELVRDWLGQSSS